jgi:hypothetical protein
MKNIIIEDSILAESKPSKKLWSFIKKQKSENIGVSPLKVSFADLCFLIIFGLSSTPVDFSFLYILSLFLISLLISGVSHGIS